ncbi:hypothetical protein D5086_013376 [Populus alba]|uniref:WRC domain-containing protein n=2 Tax=Populus alba TaxID=43335 RepID=A0A4V6A0G6_POPAL|nr:uncharacterized protein LOC118043885 isoform X2 [Populus alba]TKR71495.1 uncharacterized protein D5086_0000300190 [Populus alba]
MRIRKRQVPLPLSSLSPVPLSDPQFSQSPVVQLQLHSNPLQNLPQEPHTLACFDSHPPDKPNQPIGGGTSGLDCSDAAVAQQEKKIMLEKDERGREGERSNDTRKGSLMGAEIETMNLTPSSSSRQGVGMWGEGEKAFPLKKRRGSFERRSNDDEVMMVRDKKMKIKMNKICVQQKGNNKEEEEEEDEDEEEEEESKEIIKEGADGTTINTSARKKARGGALMEGSRCSRVNGRGWRCCQQTLVGYSLCEHHLGKGRLRSMSSVRSRSMARTAPKKAESKPLSSSSLSLEEKETKRVSPDHTRLDGDPNEDGDHKKPLMIAKKKVKLGMVKARSISSLLGQANYGIAVSEDSK